MSLDDTAKTEASAPVEVAEPPRSGVGFVTVLFMSVLAAGGGAALALVAQTQPAITRLIGLPGAASTPVSAIADTALRADLETVKTRLAALEAKSAVAAAPQTTLEAASGATSEIASAASGSQPAAAETPTFASDIGTMRAELQGLAGRLTAIETRLGALDPTGAGGAMIAGLQADVAGLKASVEAMRIAAASGPAPGVAFAAISLAEAASRSGPFIAEWEAMRAALPNNTAVEALAAVARTGAPTRTQLTERFAGVADAVRRAARTEESGQGIGGWFTSLWKSLIVVRSTDGGGGDGADAVVARGERKLTEGDFAGAVDEVSRLSGKAAEPALEWLRQARARLEIERRVATVRGTIERPNPAPPTTATLSPAPAANATATPVPTLQPAPAATGQAR